MTEGKRLTIDQLARAGQAAFGERWQTALANVLNVNSSRIRGVLAGKRLPPPGWTPEIIELLRRRSQECLDMERALENELNSGNAPDRD
ncbi:transcriptional regulator [Saccharibacter sp. 17.LH.SD]|uniref:transcriptional regulator n=1 Tax=Saccharibacter sp. 17.LH.SD TaxID=2689393 RepID=UPI00136F3DBE|nr:transcriptional regulator [Saccharibacter sp. 17.LH.SD]MXV43481.1 transcriptional regulator [Saccharibacter sp. 17.LH.SD]